MSRQFAVRIHAYCLMTNHYHLILETPQANLSRAMQWLNVSYAAYYNRRHGYAGHLFQGRYKAIAAIFHKYRIDELPVVDADNKPVGMIDVQDIVTIKVVG